MAGIDHQCRNAGRLKRRIDTVEVTAGTFHDDPLDLVLIEPAEWVASPSSLDAILRTPWVAWLLAIAVAGFSAHLMLLRFSKFSKSLPPLTPAIGSKPEPLVDKDESGGLTGG
jgi:hypothetical protein